MGTRVVRTAVGTAAAMVKTFSGQSSAAEVARAGYLVKVHYVGTFQDGSVFDSSEKTGPIEFALGSGQMIAGCAHMRKSEHAFAVVKDAVAGSTLP